MREAPSLYQRIVDERKALVRRRTRALFKDGAEEGALRGDVPVRFVEALILVTSEHLMHPDRLAELGMSPPEAFGRAINVLLDGLRPRADKPASLP